MQERIETTQKDRDWRARSARFRFVDLKPQAFAPEVVFLPQTAQDRRRFMRRIPRSGKS